MSFAEFGPLLFRHVFGYAFADRLKVFLHFSGRLKDDHYLSITIVDLGKGVGHHPGAEYAITWFCIVYLVAYFYQEFSLHHIPPFILVIMNVQRGTALFITGRFEYIHASIRVFRRD